MQKSTKAIFYNNYNNIVYRLFLIVAINLKATKSTHYIVYCNSLDDGPRPVIEYIIMVM